ncbi:MAG: preprotein translocase subunit SecG [Epulopiscium sp.]|nr:preprotein translocase subunit SecG [Candidatus Epulonipiscium sp.]
MSALVVTMQVLYVLIGIALIWVVLMQESKSGGLGAIGGSSQSYWGKNKARSLEGAFEKYTKLGAILFMILALLINVLL